MSIVLHSPVGIAQSGNIAQRDTVGDLNSEAIKRGEFAGSISLPGTRNVSLAIGGTLKTVAIWDDQAEAMGADFLPALLGSQRDDTDGAFSLDSTLSRLHMEGRAPVDNGSIRGYVEYDLNDKNNGDTAFKIRHAFGAWSTETGVLTVGKTWSTMMDLQGLPEGLTEPTVSGVIFQRQSLIRWSQPFADTWTYHLALEDTNNSDISFPVAGYQGIDDTPDIVAGFEYSNESGFHARLNLLSRDLEARDPSGSTVSETGWGAALTAQYVFSNRDKLGVNIVEGEGLGRYLLGIPSVDGSAIDPATGDIDLRDNHGAMATYLHRWSEKFRSTLMYGMAKSDVLDWQPGTTAEKSVYASANLMWQIEPYITVGFEIAYGELTYANNDSIDNTRVAAAMQLF